jgi:hypothetical protein
MLQRLRGQAEDAPARWFGQFFATHERMLWKLSDLPWDRIDRRALDAPTIAAVRAAMLVESHNPVYASTLLGKFRLDYEMTNFLAVWTYEEFKHFAGLKAYLEATESMSPAALESELAVTRAGEWLIPDNYTDIMMATYAMVQELVTGIFYKNFARHVREPVLKTLLSQIGKDEYRHCQFYFDYAKRQLDRDRSRLAEIDVALLEFEMPGPSFMPDYDRHGMAMLTAANPGVGAFREVLAKVSNLVGKLHVLQLASNAAYRARLQENWGLDTRQLLGAFS